MDSFGQQNTQSYQSNLTDMATGSIGDLVKESELLKENQRISQVAEHSINQTFIKHIPRTHSSFSPNDLQDEGLMHYVTTAFAEVCRKIDNLHNMLERQPEEQSNTEKRESLDSVIIQEEKEEKGWFERIKQIIYGKEESEEYAAPEEQGQMEESTIQVVQPPPKISAADALENALTLAEKASLKAELRRHQQREAEANEMHAGETGKRMGAEIQYHRTRADAAEAALKEARDQISIYKARLKIRKKEISDIKSSFTSSTAAESLLAKLATTASVQLARVLLLLDKPDAIEQLHQEISAGETGKLVSSLLEIETAIRDALQREKEAQEKTQREKQLISSQLKVLTKEIEKAQKDNRALVSDIERSQLENQALAKEAEEIREEKDAIINKQRLMIKLLQSKIPRMPKQRSSITQSSILKKPQPAKVPEKTKGKVERELEERIGAIKEKMKKINSTEDPTYKAHLKDLEDSTRRLNDFMQI
ncbi:hypothetical protein NEMIN01_0921 [Nematocida minor]|uniref:uncharacterized protein n=1 Tax=Nematocida minor TaxID=1912983 RepID=UPI00221E614B|nr:uncharacterized protein NEMIN01_0921 [Nematocida minor]KAI5190222.1 hypothetical protein NEMIN01_0921 [Nematocida minor]